MEPDLPESYYDQSPGPWAFHEHIYGFGHVLLDRDGRVLTANVRRGDGAVMAGAPAMLELLADLVAGVDRDKLRGRAERILREIARLRPREPGEDDE